MMSVTLGRNRLPLKVGVCASLATVLNGSRGEDALPPRVSAYAAFTKDAEGVMTFKVTCLPPVTL